MIQKLNTAISAVFIIAAVLLFAAALKRRDAAPTPTASETATNTPEAAGMQTYDDLSGMKRLNLAEDFASWTPDAKIDEEKVRTGTLAVTGKVIKAYLIVDASVEGKPLTKYESIYVKFNDAGGHLFRPQTLKTPADDASTGLLYDLSATPVLPTVPYDETRTPEMADLSASLGDGKTVKLTAFISSLRPALLKDLSVAYVCADGTDCSIELK